MTFETTAGTPAEHAQPVGGVATGRSESTGPGERTGPGEPTGLGVPTGPGERTAPTPVQIRLQILSTEHWSLLASRGLAWNEIFARAGMYLSTLSGSMVALGLIGGIDHFGDAFLTFALVLLPVVEFVGLGTWVRMGVSNYHDAITNGDFQRTEHGWFQAHIYKYDDEHSTFIVETTESTFDAQKISFVHLQHCLCT